MVKSKSLIGVDIGIFKKGRIPWNKGKHYSEELKQKLSEAHKGQISAMKGKHFSEEGYGNLK